MVKIVSIAVSLGLAVKRAIKSVNKAGACFPSKNDNADMPYFTTNEHPSPSFFTTGIEVDQQAKWLKCLFGLVRSSLFGMWWAMILCPKLKSHCGCTSAATALLVCKVKPTQLPAEGRHISKNVCINRIYSNLGTETRLFQTEKHQSFSKIHLSFSRKKGQQHRLRRIHTHIHHTHSF